MAPIESKEPKPILDQAEEAYNAGVAALFGLPKARINSKVLRSLLELLDETERSSGNLELSDKLAELSLGLRKLEGARQDGREGS